MLRSIRLILIVAMTFASFGCDDPKAEVVAGDDGGKKRKKEKKADDDAESDRADEVAEAAGADSPEAAFAALQKGVNERDFRAFFRVLHTESQNNMLAGQLVGASITLAPMGTKPNPDKKKELDAIFEKYGVEDDGSPVKPGTPAQMTAEVGKKLEKVKDRPGLFHELMLYLEKNSLENEQATIESLENLAKQGDDKATGTVVMKYAGGRVERRPVEFRREGGRWYVFLTKWV